MKGKLNIGDGFGMETGLKLGSRITALRKEKGMTQEQLAAALGVSAPAVSKWETDTSCPDIALLCPLARALGTNVDTLLQFEEQPSQKQIEEWMNGILEKARLQEADQAEAMLQEILHRYPSSAAVKYHAAVVLSVMEMWGMTEPAEKRERWKAQKKQLLWQIHEEDKGTYSQLAIIQLSSFAIAENDLEKAEQLLNELPEETAQYPVDPAMIWVMLYQKRGETEKAKEMLQKRLYVQIRHAQNCLMQLMNPELTPDTEEALKLCEVYRQVDSIFRLGGNFCEGIFAEIYMRAGEIEKSLDCILKMVKAACSPVQMPNPLLFSAMQKERKEADQPAMSKELRRTLLIGLQNEEQYAAFREDRRFKEAVELLEKCDL